MNKLTLDDLRRQYSDRPHPAEVEELIPEPISIESEVPDVLSITPEVTTARMSTTPLVGFLVFAGFAMFAGFAVLVNIELNNETLNQDVLGAIDVQTTTERQSPVTENVIPAGRDVEPIIEDNYDLIIGDDAGSEEQPVVAEDTNDIETDVETEEELAVVTNVRVREVEGGYVNLRRDPLLDPFSRAASGTEFEMVSEVSLGEYTWIEVKYDEGTTCWIRGDLIEKL